MVWLEIGMILLLILLNGFFAMSELAVLSARKGLLRRQAEAGEHSAQVTLDFLSDSSHFLAAIQIGITSIGILTGVFSGASVAEHLASLLRQWPSLAPSASILSLPGVVLVLSFLTLVFGELVPKQIGLRHPEAITRRVGRQIRAAGHPKRSPAGDQQC